MKKIIFFVLGAAVAFILSGIALSKASSGSAIYIMGASTLFGGLLGSLLAGRAKGEIESEKTSGFAKAIIWFLVIAIIVVAVIAFLGQNR